MRSSKSRSRGNKTRSRQNHGNNQNRVFDSSGPEGKVRGTPQQIIDKYNQLARDAQLSNDRVAVENFQQHAEHYTRMLADALREAEAKREQQETQNRERQQQRDAERVERQERDAARRDNVVTQADDKQVDPASAPQPDMAPAKPADDNGLVETPESKPAPRKRTRKPKSNPVQQAEDTPDTPEAAE